jgi:hypothetical protein
VPGVEEGVHRGEVEGVVVFGAGGCGDGEEEVVAWGAFGGVGVQGGAAGLEEEDVVLGFVCGGGVLPVDVETVKAPVCDGGVSGDGWE